MSLSQGLMSIVKAYRFFLSPWLGSACRFTPTCSEFALEALERHGAGAGTYLALRRLGRCNPWCAGGVDLVPEQAPRVLSGVLPAGRPAPGPQQYPTKESITHE